MNRRSLLLLAAASLVLIWPAPVRVWQWRDPSLEPVALPLGSQLLPEVTQADFDQDGHPESVALDGNGRAVIRSGSSVRWQSPPGWQVRQALVADLNHDGWPEAVLLVWRPFQSWPIDRWLPSGGRIDSFHDARGMSCQIILIGWYQNAFRERWAGSALAEPVDDLAVADLAGDGRQLLLTLEAEYDDPPSAPARRFKLWDWNGFGFSLVYTLQGPFDKVQLLRAPDGRSLLALP